VSDAIFSREINIPQVMFQPKEKPVNTETAPAKHPGRFSYVAYDETAKAKQEAFKARFEQLEAMAIETLPAGRSLSLFLTALEEAYMWTGKALRDEQVARNSQPEHVPARTNE
jgi:hypothetical protein